MKDLDLSKPLRMKISHEEVKVVFEDCGEYLAVKLTDLGTFEDLEENEGVQWRSPDILKDMIENVPEKIRILRWVVCDRDGCVLFTGLTRGQAEEYVAQWKAAQALYIVELHGETEIVD